MLESRVILSTLLLHNLHKHNSSQRSSSFHSNAMSPTAPPPNAASVHLLPGSDDPQSNAADAEQGNWYLSNLARLFQRLQTAVVTRFHVRKKESFGDNNHHIFGVGIVSASVQYSIPSQVLLQPLSTASITVQIVAVNAVRGGRAIDQSATAAKCAKLMTDCGISRSSSGALVALLHTHRQMCLQLQGGNTNAPSEFVPQSTIWVPSLTLLHLMGLGEGTLHAVNDSQHQGAMRALADVLVEAGLSFKYLDCVDQWTSEAIPVKLQRGSNNALAAAHQLRLQHVGEVLPVQAVVIGLEAVLNCSSCSDIQVLLHAVAAIDASMLALMQHAHSSARQLLQLSDLTLSAISLHHQPSFEPQLSVVVEKHSYNTEITQTHRSKSLVDLIVSAHVLLPFLRAASNAIHCDVTKLQVIIQIAFVKLCSAAMTAQRLIAEAPLSAKSDFPALQDCFDRGCKTCSNLRQSAIRIIQACNSARACDVLQVALCNADFLSEALSQANESEAATTSSNQYSLQLRACSSVVHGQLEGSAALHSQAVAMLRLAWDIEALLMHGHCLLMKKHSNFNDALLRQIAAASADMLNGDCELPSSVVSGSLPSTWPPLLRKCSGYNSVLQSMRKGHKDVPPPAKSSAVDHAKKRSLLLLYCVENRDTREQSGPRSVIDITDIKFPSPRRL